MAKIMFLCNGKRKSCCTSTVCGVNFPDGDECKCFHTTNERYALNKDTDPETRPFFIRDYDHPNYYWEGFIGDGMKGDI